MTCPKCAVYVTVDDPTGTILPHGRFIDGGGPGVNQDHTIVPCEAGGLTPNEAEELT